MTRRLTNLSARSNAATTGWPATAFRARFGTYFEAGRIRPVVHCAFPLAQAPEAHRLLKASTHFGKVVLRIREDER